MMARCELPLMLLVKDEKLCLWCMVERHIDLNSRLGFYDAQVVHS